jgi:CHAT domain-containing protein
MAQRFLRGTILILAAALVSCSRHSQPSPQSAYDDARQKFEHGELIAAQAEADRYSRSYAEQNPQWAWKFRILEAETLILRGMSPDALALLTPEPPAALSMDEVAVRRKLWQSAALPVSADAKRSLDEAEQLALNYQPKLVDEVELRKGIFFLRSSNFTAAEASFRKALEIARRQSQPYLEASALINLGFTAMKNQHYGEAIDWNNAALTLAQSQGARVLVEKITGNLGACYHQLGDLDAALNLFNKSDDQSVDLHLQKDQIIWLYSIGNIHYDRWELEEAKSSYQEALRMARAPELDDRRNQAICLNNLAIVSFDQKQWDDAEKYNQQAFALRRGDKDKTSELSYLYNQARITAGRGKLQEAKKSLQQVIEGSSDDFALRWIAQAKLADLYASLNQPQLAEREFQQALATVHQERSSLKREEYRLTFLSGDIRFYSDYVHFLLSRGKTREALRVVELNRARTLEEGLGLDQSGDSLAPAAFRPQEIARRSGAVVLYYSLAPAHSYLWAITSSQLTMFMLPPESEIDQAVLSYRQTLAGPRDAREIADANGQKLYQLLVAPVQKLIPQGSQVVIMPDKSLYELNFETLLAPGQHLHYWIEDVVISNASSLLLLRDSKVQKARGTKKLLLIGDPAPPTPEFALLPQAASEMERVKKYFPANQVKTYSGKNATATAYLQGDPEKFSHIHFVAHGTASRESPLDSAVILSGDESSYKLYARDIIRKRLHARLVTISSCEGASGNTYASEGLVGLSWAFLRAGAHEVIAALWEVNDTSTPQFMDRFYGEINAGKDPTVALRTAKLAMLHSDNIYRRPFYWAPFQLYKGL